MKKRAISIMALTMLAVLLLTSCGSGVTEQEAGSASGELEYSSFEQLENGRIGVLTGSTQPEIVSRRSLRRNLYIITAVRTCTRL